MRIPLLLLPFIASLYCLFAGPSGTGRPGPGNPSDVSIVTDPSLPAPAAYGLEKMIAALKTRNLSVDRAATLESARGRYIVTAGLASAAGPASAIIRNTGLENPAGAEALLIRRIQWKGRPLLLLAGADARGLMYAELEAAERIGWSPQGGSPFQWVRDTSERPDAPQRALSIYTMNRAYWESRFYDEAYWSRYLDTLARNRFNSVVIIFGYENGGFLAPCYPYFFDLTEFPNIRMIGITAEQQRRNLDALNRLIRMAHERGLEFTVGIWDHIYRGGVQGGGVSGADEATRKPTPGLVWGLTGDNLIPYTRAALARFIRLVPDLDRIQFRMHDESGLKKEEQLAFWRDVFRMVRDDAPGLRLDLRAKGLPDTVIEAGLELGLRLRITTKYWMEQMGLPFHPTHINRQDQSNRRHSYADLLRFPQKYKLHWRLWNGGTARVLLWGDPDYVRRFVASTHLYDGEGFEVNEPLATKMEAQPHDTPPFDLLKQPYRYYDYEFERYWHFFQLFGRLGYNPQTPPELWTHEFETRFGPVAGAHLLQGLHAASQVLPRIVAACYPYSAFPMTRGWAERQRLGDLPAYARAEGSDIQQFVGFDEEAQNIIDGRSTAKIRPEETSRWFERTARKILEEAAAAEAGVGAKRSREFDSTITDLKILAGLARFHSRRIPAAVSLRLFERTRDLNSLDDAIQGERLALEAWKELVRAAGNVYADNLAMGVCSANLCGHWKDDVQLFEKGLRSLDRQREEYQPPSVDTGPRIMHVPLRRLEPGTKLALRATAIGADPTIQVRAFYRVASGEYRTAEMRATEPRIYRADIPVPAQATALDYFIEATNGRSRVFFPTEGSNKPVSATISGDSEPPAIRHKPIAAAKAGLPLEIAAEVLDPSGIQSVRLLYRSVNQTEDYRVLEMRPVQAGNRFEARVPAEHVAPGWDFMYLIEAVDKQGNGRIFPDLNRGTPYVVVRLSR